jgi:hypothetical protein
MLIGRSADLLIEPSHDDMLAIIRRDMTIEFTAWCNIPCFGSLKFPITQVIVLHTLFLSAPKAQPFYFPDLKKKKNFLYTRICVVSYINSLHTPGSTTMQLIILGFILNDEKNIV